MKKAIPPLEGLLRPIRPPLEWYAAGVSLAGTGLVLLKPQWFLLSSTTYWVVVAIFSSLSAKRFYQGCQLIRYQKNLKHLPDYRIKSQEISPSQNKLFLGRGFRWEVKHTQRLRDCLIPENTRYLQPSWFYKTIRQLELRLEHRAWAKCWLRLLFSPSCWNPFRSLRPLPAVGGQPALHGVEPKEQAVWMNLSERVGHMLVLGTTRVGKTRFLELLVSQDIRRGDAVIVFDPKGDVELLRRIYFEAQLCGREQNLIIFHLGFPEVSARYNPIGQFARITEVANRIANQLPGSGESAAFKEFGWRFINIIAKALVALGRKPDYQQIQRYILNIDDLLIDYCQAWLSQVDSQWQQAVISVQNGINERDLPTNLRGRSFKIIAMIKYIQSQQLYDPIAEGLCSAFNYDKSYFDKITASLLPLIEKLTSGKTAELISPQYFDLDDPRPIFDWMQVIRGKKIVYIGLDALSDTTVASAVGNSMFNDLCSLAGQLYKYGVEGHFAPSDLSDNKKLHPVCIHSDEFNELIGDEFIPLLNKAGGAGLQITAYTQTWSDVEARLHDKAKAGQVGGNFNTLVCLRVLEENTAKLLTDKLPQKVFLSQIAHISSVRDSSNLGSVADFSSTNEDRLTHVEAPLLTSSDLIQLPKGQAFALIEGGQLWKIRMPLPQDDLSHVPSSMEALARSLIEKMPTLSQKISQETGS